MRRRRRRSQERRREGSKWGTRRNISPHSRKAWKSLFWLRSSWYIYIFVSPLLHGVHHLPIDRAQDWVDDQEEKKFAADQLVQRTCTIVMYNLTLPRSCIWSILYKPFHLNKSLVKPPAVEEATSLWYEIVIFCYFYDHCFLIVHQYLEKDVFLFDQTSPSLSFLKVTAVHMIQDWRFCLSSASYLQQDVLIWISCIPSKSLIFEEEHIHKAVSLHSLVYFSLRFSQDFIWIVKRFYTSWHDHQLPLGPVLQLFSSSTCSHIFVWSGACPNLQVTKIIWSMFCPHLHLLIS